MAAVPRCALNRGCEFFRWLFKPKVVILPMPWRVVVEQLPDKHRATNRSGVWTGVVSGSGR